MRLNHRAVPLAAPSPRLRGEGRGEGAYPKRSGCGEAPSPGSRKCAIRPLPASGERLTAASISPGCALGYPQLPNAGGELARYIYQLLLTASRFDAYPCRPHRGAFRRRVGVVGIVVHAISAEAKAFYLALGFEVSPLQPMTLMATLADLKATL